VPAGPVNDIDKIPHEPIVEESVPKIAENSRGKKSQSKMDRFLPGAAEEKDAEDNYQGSD
jgi:hypothetical protein